MKALVYGGPGTKAWKDVPDPGIVEPTDAVVRIDTTTICGTDLHILKGDVPAVEHGRILGHEGVGTVTEVGSSVSGIRAGDRVIISCIKSCGHCVNCRKGLFSHCLETKGKWVRAGSLVISLTAPGRSSFAFPMRTTPFTSSRTGSATMRLSCCPISFPRPSKSACWMAV